MPGSVNAHLISGPSISTKHTKPMKGHFHCRANMPMQYTAIFHGSKNVISDEKM